MNTLLILLFAAIGAFLSRNAGGGWPTPPWKPLPKLLYAIPYGLIAGPWLCFPCLVAAFAGKCTGHGQYLKWGRKPAEPIAPERLDFIVRFFMGPDPGDSVRRDAVGMAVTGLAVSLAPGLALLLTGHVLSGLLVTLSGLGKPLAYWLGDRYAVMTGKKYTTFQAEVLTGFFGWGGVACSVLLL